MGKRRLFDVRGRDSEGKTSILEGKTSSMFLKALANQNDVEDRESPESIIGGFPLRSSGRTNEHSTVVIAVVAIPQLSDPSFDGPSE